MKIIHISDLHFGDKATNTRKVVDRIIDYYDSVDKKPLIINSGDLVDNGTKKLMRGCKQQLERLVSAGFEMLIVPGNHDLKKVHSTIPVLRGLGRFNKYFKDLLPKGTNFYGEEDNNLFDFPIVHKYDKYYFIGLDSNEAQRITGAKGELGTDQLDELKEVIEDIKEDNQNAVIIIYLHHHPFEYKVNLKWWFDFDNMQLLDRKKFQQIIQGNVDVLLFGHLHSHKYDFEAEKKKLGAKVVQLFAVSSWRREHPFSEINLESFEVKLI